MQATMSSEQLEHVNITVRNIDTVVAFVQAALPGLQVRGQGTMDWFGKPIRWLHIGTPECYLALQEGGEGEDLHWQTHAVGPKHIGIVVPSVDAVVARLAEAGQALDHWGGTHRFRRSVYFVGTGTLQFEFVEYLSVLSAERNDYA